MLPLTLFKVDDSSHVGEMRRLAAAYSRECQLSETEAGSVAIIATELANNLYRYGEGGYLLVQNISSSEGDAVEIVSIDTGPGMEDVERCLTDGFSTGATPGTGLGAIRRLSSEFDIFSSQPAGTVIVSRVRRGTPSPKTASISWASMALPMRSESVCGDTWRVASDGRTFSVLVADGLGHGELAAKAANVIGDAFMATPYAPPAKVMAAAHTSAIGTRGAAVAIGLLDIAAEQLSFCGIGNIAGTVFDGDTSQGLASLNGIVGAHQSRRLREFVYPWRKGGLLVMCSDGLQTRWSLDQYPGLRHRHPAVIAGVLLRDFSRGRDDVTVLVARLGNYQ